MEIKISQGRQSRCIYLINRCQIETAVHAGKSSTYREGTPHSGASRGSAGVSERAAQPGGRMTQQKSKGWGAN